MGMGCGHVKQKGRHAGLPLRGNATTDWTRRRGRPVCLPGSLTARVEKKLGKDLN